LFKSGCGESPRWKFGIRHTCRLLASFRARLWKVGDAQTVGRAGTSPLLRRRLRTGGLSRNHPGVFDRRQHQHLHLLLAEECAQEKAKLKRPVLEQFYRPLSIFG
jgi:hypothetical protein